MFASPPKKERDWLGGLPNLHDRLDAAGIATEPGQRAAILHVIGKRQLGDWPGAPDIDLLLTPLLAQTPEDQDMVRALLKTWSDSLDVDPARPAAASSGAFRAAPVMHAEPPAPASEVWASEAAAPRALSRAGFMAFLGLAFFGLVALAMVTVWSVTEPPSNVNEPPSNNETPNEPTRDPNSRPDRRPAAANPPPERDNVLAEVPGTSMPLGLRLSLAALPVLAFAVYLVWLMARRGRWLATGLALARSAGPPIRLTLDLDGPDTLFTPGALRKGSQTLKAPLKVEGHRLDIGRTVEATAGAAGFFSPVNAMVRVEPEYVFLIERLSPHDHAAKLFDLAVERLRDKQHGVVIHRFFFQHDLRRVYTDDAGLPAVMDIRDLSERFQRNRVFVLGTADGFFHPLDDSPQPWTRTLLEWQKRAVLHVRPVRHWGPTELRLLESGFALATATASGLQRVAGYAGLPSRAITRPLLEGRRVEGMTVTRPEPDDMVRRPATPIQRGLARTVCNDVLFTADGRSVMTAGRDGAITLWDARTGEAQAVLAHHERGEARALAMPIQHGDRVFTASELPGDDEKPIPSGNPNYVVSVGDDGITRFSFPGYGIDAATRQPIKASRVAHWGPGKGGIPDQTGQWAVAVSDDGHWVAHASRAGVVSVCNVASRLCQSAFRPAGDRPVRALSFLKGRSNADVVTLGYDTQVLSGPWDTGDRSESGVTDLGRGATAIATHPDDDMTVIATRDGPWLRVARHDVGVQLFRRPFTLGGTEETDGSDDLSGPRIRLITALAFSFAGDMIAVGDDNGLIWRIKLGAENDAPMASGKPLKGLKGPVRHIDWARDGSKLVAVDDHGQVALWDLATGEMRLGPSTVPTRQWIKALLATITQRLVRWRKAAKGLRSWAISLRQSLIILRHQLPEYLWVLMVAFVVLMGSIYTWWTWIAERPGRLPPTSPPTQNGLLDSVPSKAAPPARAK